MSSFRTRLMYRIPQYEHIISVEVIDMIAWLIFWFHKFRKR